MGLMLHSLAELPITAERSYYIYLLDFGWAEPIVKTLKENFEKMAILSSQTNSIVMMGLEGSHFNDDVLSWHNINGLPGEEILPALLVTTLHPHFFKINSETNYTILQEDYSDKLLIIPLRKICKEPKDVVVLIEKLFRDIADKKTLGNFQVVKEMKKGKKGALADALLLEPNIGGLGLNLNKIINYFLERDN
jgi:hypothetical protein